MSIARDIFDNHQETGEFVIPDGQKGVVACFPLSTDPEDKRRSIQIVFEDESNLSIDLLSSRLFWTPAGDITLESFDKLVNKFKEE